MSFPKTTFHYLSLSNATIFYRTAGSPSNPTILLLHGFPTSSFMFRNLIPLLAQRYHVVAPDIPAFGFTTTKADYKYTFENFTTTIGEFLDALRIKSFIAYMFDYGAPIVLRLVLQRPNAIRAIISQNGNAYEEGLGSAWDPIKKYWKSHSEADREIVRQAMLTFDATKTQYTHGTANADSVAPESYTLDYALLGRPGNKEIQLDLFYDYQYNVDLYPKFQEYLRHSQVPILVAWGKHDVIFVPPGAEAYKRDLPKAQVHLLDAGHFVEDTNTEEIGHLILGFLKNNEI